MVHYEQVVTTKADHWPGHIQICSNLIELVKIYQSLVISDPISSSFTTSILIASNHMWSYFIFHMILCNLSNLIWSNLIASNIIRSVNLVSRSDSSNHLCADLIWADSCYFIQPHWIQSDLMHSHYIQSDLIQSNLVSSGLSGFHWSYLIYSIIGCHITSYNII